MNRLFRLATAGLWLGLLGSPHGVASPTQDGSVDDVPWDGHANIETNHRECGLATDRPVAA